MLFCALWVAIKDTDDFYVKSRYSLVSVWRELDIHKFLILADLRLSVILFMEYDIDMMEYQMVSMFCFIGPEMCV